MQTVSDLNLREAYSSIDMYIVRDYVAGLANKDELLDMVSAALDENSNKSEKKKENFYPEVSLYSRLIVSSYETNLVQYFTSTKMNTGVRGGTLHQGMFNVSAYNNLEVGQPSAAWLTYTYT